MRHMVQKNVMLFAILAIASFFILFRLTQADTLTDEVELAFRGIGYLDFLATPFQTTPYEWFERLPWWASWSFHDHPPLVILLDHIVFRFFGDGLLALRLPYALLGIASIGLLYAVGKQLFGERAGLATALLGSVNAYLIWISRIGLQEGVSIFFGLLCVFFLLKAKDQPKYFIGWGIALGLAWLTKYTSFILLPISVGYVLLAARQLPKEKYFYAGLALAVLLFSPVLVYNIAMYGATGHFDLQFSTLLGQRVAVWQELPGKNIGSLWHRLTTFYPNLYRYASPLFFLASLFSLVWLLIKVFKAMRTRTGVVANELFLLVILLFYHALIVLVGPSERFLALLVPWMLLLVGYVCADMLERLQKPGRFFGYGFFALVIGYEALFSYQTNHALEPLKNSHWIFSPLRYESSSWGYNELEQYLVREFDSHRPAVQLDLPSKLQFIKAIRAADWRHIRDNPATATLIMYDPRMNNVAKHWLFDRRYYYDGWPIVSLDEYAKVKEVAPDYLAKLGIAEYYYIAASDSLFTGGNTVESKRAVRLNRELVGKGIKPVELIRNKNGEEVFMVYTSSQPF